MSVLVVYESMYGNTHLVADAVARGLGEAGVPAEVLSIRDAWGRPLADDDVLVVGAPTHGHGLSRENSREQAVHDADRHHLRVDESAEGPGVREWLASLPAGTGRAAAFDTRVKGPRLLTGQASRKIADALEEHGHRLLTGPESFLVTLSNELAPGEADRARQWGAALAAAL
ncbi:flavodoxin [Kocuria dechangensis]|uniref:Flavodoxin n=1 Tax=Kocuria dechangensis TaxID=1176249 RepID=A0A917LR14_9MICC|nr:flavodoxin domain-containing protein [Kocuria dechangensis]GGG51960.1 flavodoxin [Kocuria dechangensis]